MCKSLQIADGIRYSAIPRSYLQTVQGGEGHIEMCPQLVGASCLALFKRGEALCIAEFKFHQKPTSVDFYDVHACKRKIVGEEYLVLALVLGNPDDDLYFLPKRLAVDNAGIALPSIEVVAYLMEHLHVEVPHINLPVILLGGTGLASLRAVVDIVQGRVIPESAYNLQPKISQPVNEILLGEESIGNDSLGILIDGGIQACQNMKVPVNEGEAMLLLFRIPLLYLSLQIALVIRTLHLRPCYGLDMLYVCHCLAAYQIPYRIPLLVNSFRGNHAAVGRLESSKHEALMEEGVHDAHSEQLKSPFGLPGRARPEEPKSRSVLARLADIARIDSQCLDADAVLEIVLGHAEVERYRVCTALLEVVAIGLLVIAAEGGKLSEISFLHHYIKN